MWRHLASIAGLVFPLTVAVLVAGPAGAQTAPLRTLSNEQLADEIDRRRRRTNGRTLDAEISTIVREAMRRGGRRPIYGTDSRQDWSDFRFDPIVRKRGRASAAMFLTSELSRPSQASGKFAIALKISFKMTYGLCPGEPFLNQTTAAACSGVLIERRTLLTAGHCVQQETSSTPDVPKLDDVFFVFGFYADEKRPNGTTSFPPAQVYRAHRVISRKFEESTGADYAVIELDRDVDPAVAEPVEADVTVSVAAGEGVYVVGYPNGLPVKYATGAKVRDVSKSEYFVANLDTYGGNSGSGVYSARNHKLVGLLVRGENDFIRDDKMRCSRSFVCPTTGCKGEHVMRLSKIDLNGEDR